MYVDPKYGLVAPDAGTSLDELGDQFVQMIQSFSTALERFDYNGADPNLVLAKVASLESAVDGLFKTSPEWVTVPLGPSAAGTVEYAILRGEVLVRAQITTSMAAGATLAIGNLPTEARPPVSEPIGVFATGAQLSALALNTGELRVVNHSSATSTNTKFVSGRWPKRAA